MPFAIKVRWGLRILVWHGENYSDYLAPLLSRTYTLNKEEFLIIFDKIKEKFKNLDLVNSKNQPKYINQVENPFVIFLKNIINQDSYFINLENNWDVFYNNNVTAKTRNTDRRKEKKLDSLGDLKFQINNDSDFEEILDFIVNNKLKIKNKLDVIMFYKNLFNDKKKNFKILSSTIRINKKIISACLGFIYQDIYYYILSSYVNDAVIKNNSPGRILFLKLLKWCSENSIFIIDLTDGKYEYKLHFASDKKPLFQYFSSISIKGYIFLIFYKLITRIRFLYNYV